ncbi:hypothetical protein PVNG_06401 [Plasmodium vivax North Korean]|uniref:Uncharacterized protein n=1 Tax=Plasmodium vivax North Korean TaxID=1035514 RepID=A0A0J9WEL4_PLAVI|nr:hypothetical protein PVNG_06401 [Plasmodium vivax North Korean]
MITRDTKNTILRQSKNYIYYIEENEVNNMYNLFYIYKSYNDFKKIMDSEYPNKDTAIKYITHCTQKYKELKAKYSEKNTHLSNALNTFKTKYEQTELYKAKLLEWKIEKLPSLDDTEDIQEKVTELSKINSSPVGITTEASILRVQPALTRGTSAAALAHPEALMNQFAESGESNPSDQIQSLQSGDNAVRSEENGSTGLKDEGDLSDYTRTIVGPAIGTIGLSSIFFIFYKVKFILKIYNMSQYIFLEHKHYVICNCISHYSLLHLEYCCFVEGEITKKLE